jgi:hypothetical protein
MLPSLKRTRSAPRNSTRFAAQYPARGHPCERFAADLATRLAHHSGPRRLAIPFLAEDLHLLFFRQRDWRTRLRVNRVAVGRGPASMYFRSTPKAVVKSEHWHVSRWAKSTKSLRDRSAAEAARLFASPAVADRTIRNPARKTRKPHLHHHGFEWRTPCNRRCGVHLDGQVETVSVG